MPQVVTQVQKVKQKHYNPFYDYLNRKDNFMKHLKTR
jgi:hypothetical protein